MKDAEKLPLLVVTLAAGYLAGVAGQAGDPGNRQMVEGAVKSVFGVLRAIEERLEAGNG